MKKALVVDIDGTVYRWHLVLRWLELLAKSYPQVRELLDLAAPDLAAYRKRKGSFQTYISKIARLFWDERRFVGIRQEDSLRVAETAAQSSHEHVYVFTRELISAAKACDWLVMAISGSPQEVLDVFAKLLGINAALGTIHPVDAQGFFTDGLITAPVNNKGAALQALLDTHGDQIDRQNLVVVGDTLNDASMLERAAFPICFNPSNELALEAKRKNWSVVVERTDNAYVVQQADRGLNAENHALSNILPMDLADELHDRLPPTLIF